MVVEFAGSVDTGTIATIWVTPVGMDAADAISRTIEIRLMSSGTVISPFGATVGFTFTPETPAVLDQVRFTTQCADEDDTDCVRDPGGVITSYS